eukprot:g28229.t1
MFCGGLTLFSRYFFLRKKFPLHCFSISVRKKPPGWHHKRKSAKFLKYAPESFHPKDFTSLFEKPAFVYQGNTFAGSEQAHDDHRPGCRTTESMVYSDRASYQGARVYWGQDRRYQSASCH